jgi:hypothetical protein
MVDIAVSTGVKATVAPLPFEAMVTISEGGAEGEIEKASGARERHVTLQDCCQCAFSVFSEGWLCRRERKKQVEGYQFAFRGGVEYRVDAENGLLPDALLARNPAAL